MDSTTLVSEYIETGATLVSRIAERVPLIAALWVKPADDDRWRLLVCPGPTREAAREVVFEETVRLQRELRLPPVNFLRVRVVDERDSHVVAARGAQELFGADKPIRLPGFGYGFINVDEAYVYPLPTTTPADAPAETSSNS